MVAAPSRWCGCSASASAAPGTDPAPLLEVLTRRYYGNKGLTDVRTRDVAGCTFVVAEHAEPARVVSAAVRLRALADAVRGLAELAADVPAGAHVDADIYLRWENQPDVRRDGGRACGEVITAAPAAGPGPPGHHHRRRAAAAR